MKLITALTIASVILALLRIFNVLNTPWVIVILPFAIAILILATAIFILKILGDYDKILEKEWERNQ